jgi:hypothetical protein
MSLLIKTKRKFKPNIAIDMVASCLAHYKRFERPVKEIVLNEALFHKWKEGMMERDETLEIYDRMEFRNCTVIKGSKFMTKNMTVTLKELVAI